VLSLRIAWRAIGRGDFEVPRLAYEPDVEVVLVGAEGLGLAGHYSGQLGWTEFIGDIFESFGEPRWTTHRLRDAGDRLVAEIRLTGRGKASGAPVAESVTTVYWFSSRGKVARQDVFWMAGAWDRALEAAGLPR
jgi:hypothetical protein